MKAIYLYSQDQGFSCLISCNISCPANRQELLAAAQEKWSAGMCSWRKETDGKRKEKKAKEKKTGVCDMNSDLKVRVM